MSIFNLKNIRDRILLSFLILVVTIISLAFYAFFSLRESEAIRKVSSDINQLERTTLLLLKTDIDFLYFETINLEFYETGNSSVLNFRDSLVHKIREDYKIVSEELEDKEFMLGDDLKRVYRDLMQYDSTFKSLVELTQHRGFKDFGLEGQMRDFAHELEDNSSASGINLEDVLSLRRHEKDYFMRNELSYVNKLNSLSNKIMGSLSNFGKDTLIYELLTGYTSTFNEVVEIEKNIGLMPGDGLLGDLKTQKDTLTNKFVYLSSIANGQATNLIEKSSQTFIIIAVFSSLISFLLSYVLATMISNPVLRLSKIMGDFSIHRSVKMTDELKNLERTEEIKNLFNAFSKLSEQVHEQVEEIEEKSVLLEEQNKKLIETNKQLDRFLYSTAHDFRSPLSSVLGLINVSRMEKDAAKWSGLMNMMEDSINKLDDFIKEIVDYAKNKNLEIQDNEIDVRGMSNYIFDRFKHLSTFQRIERIIETEGEFPFIQDQHRLEIIMGNLIENAIKYHDYGKEGQYIKIEASIRPDKVVLKVEDNGRGIEKEYQDRIFDMFYRANEHSKGSGLGLFLVSESLEMIGGNINVFSEYRKGTTFVMEIPNRFGEIRLNLEKGISNSETGLE